MISVVSGFICGTLSLLIVTRRLSRSIRVELLKCSLIRFVKSDITLLRSSTCLASWSVVLCQLTVASALAGFVVSHTASATIGSSLVLLPAMALILLAMGTVVNHWLVW